MLILICKIINRNIAKLWQFVSKGGGVKADCISARVHEFFLVEKVSCGIKSHVAETYEIVSHVYQAKKQKEMG